MDIFVTALQISKPRVTRGATSDCTYRHRPTGESFGTRAQKTRNAPYPIERNASPNALAPKFSHGGNQNEMKNSPGSTPTQYKKNAQVIVDGRTNRMIEPTSTTVRSMKTPTK